MGGACSGSGSGRGKMRTVRMWRGGGEGGIGAKISHSPCHKLHMVQNCSGVRNIRLLSLLHCKSLWPWYNFFSNTKLKTSSLISIFSHFATLVMGIILVKHTNLHHSLETIQLYLQLYTSSVEAEFLNSSTRGCTLLIMDLPKHKSLKR